MLMLLGAVASSMSASCVRGMNITVMLSIWRFVLGIGMYCNQPPTCYTHPLMQNRYWW